VTARGKAGDVPDLGDHHGSGDETDAGNGQQTPDAVVVGEDLGELSVGEPDLGGDGVDQAQVGGQALLGEVWQAQPLE
jgi:hypothetical protein